MRDPVPVISDQHDAARAYFLSVFALLLIEGLIYVPSYVNKLWKPGEHHRTQRVF
jgi:hypothetical protein